MANTSLRDKKIWITGASSGIGESLAIACARLGAKVLISARRESELKRVQAICNNLCPNSTQLLVLDLTAAATLKTAVETAHKLLEGIDILVNNGGIAQRGLAVNMDIEAERMMMETNYFSAVALTKYTIPYMQKNGSGVILIISSIMGEVGMPYASTYAASKHALNGYFESMATELLPHNIRVKIAMPGYVRTNVSINAVLADGTRHGKMDKGQAKGMPPEVLADKLIHFIGNNKRELIVAGQEGWIVFFKKYLPFLYYRIASSQYHKVYQKYGNS